MLHVDGDTVWQDVFDALTVPEQACIRGELDDDLLQSVLERQVLAEVDSDELQDSVSIYSCLTPDNAQSIYLTGLISGILEMTGAGNLSEDETSCLHALVADRGAVALMTADDAVIATELMPALVDCIPSLFVDVILGEMGIDVADLSDDEFLCVQRWLSGPGGDVLGAAGSSDVAAFEFGLSLIDCAPGVVLGAALAAAGADMRDLSGDEIECLRQSAAALDLDELAAAELGDVAVSAGFELSLARCVPDVVLAGVLAAAGVVMRGLSGHEMECLHESVADIDLDELAFALAHFDAAIEGYGLPLARCVPDVFLDAVLAEIGLDVADLSGDDMECLRRWLSAIDLDEVGTVLTATELWVSTYESGPGDCVRDLLPRA